MCCRFLVPEDAREGRVQTSRHRRQVGCPPLPRRRLLSQTAGLADLYAAYRSWARVLETSRFLWMNAPAVVLRLILYWLSEAAPARRRRVLKVRLARWASEK
jgi:hypothetical protein